MVNKVTTNITHILGFFKRWRFALIAAFVLADILAMPLAIAASDYPQALRRARYLLNGAVPTEDHFTRFSGNAEAYKQGVREYLNSDGFYEAALRYHQRLLGVGLPMDYIEEMFREDLDNKTTKIASIQCNRSWGRDRRFTCYWTSQATWRTGRPPCPTAMEKPARVFWNNDTTAWVCPSVIESCGYDLSRCLVRYYPEGEARNSRLGTSEIFDSRFAIVKALSMQSAGLAASVAYDNYPYTMILEPGLTAIDGTIAHFLQQKHHFRVKELGFNQEIQDAAASVPISEPKYQLLKIADPSGNTAGILSTFGWLRRYSKNRTRANEMYERLLCRKFTAELPQVFPADPGNLREKPGCAGCHATLDPLADFFLGAGEGGDLYSGGKAQVQTYFNAQYGSTLGDLANIVRNDQAFATCTVQNVFKWLVGRQFHQKEDNLRSQLAQYLITTKYSFKELVYAIVTHPVFTDSARSDAKVALPLSDPVMGTFVGEKIECNDGPYTYDTHVKPYIGLCTSCHNASSPQSPLTNEAEWLAKRSQSLSMVASGEMPPGQGGTISADATTLRNGLHCWQEASP